MLPIGGPIGPPSPGSTPSPKKPGESPLGGKKIKETTTGESVSYRSRPVHGRNVQYEPDARKIADWLALECTKDQADVFLNQARKYPGKTVPVRLEDKNGEISYDAKTQLYTVKKAKTKPGYIV